MGFFDNFYRNFTLPGWIHSGVDALRGDGDGGPAPTTVDKKYEQGTANFFDDSYLPVLEHLRPVQGQEGAAGAYESILRNFKGDRKHLETFLQRIAPFIASSIGGTEAFQDLQDYKGRADLTGQYGVGAGQIGQAQTQAVQQGQTNLANRGLGNSAAMASIASNAAMQGGAQRSALWQSLNQQSQALRQNYAQQAFDSHRMLATLALGHNPQPRVSTGGGNNPWGAIAGAGLGAVGTILGGPVGGAIFGGAGNAAGNAIGRPSGSPGRPLF